MSISTNIDLKQAKNLYDQGKYLDLIQIIDEFEGEKEKFNGNKLDWLILKAQSYLELYRYEEALNTVETVLQDSQSLGSNLNIFDALLVRRDVYNFDDNDIVIQTHKKLEKIFFTLKDMPLSEKMEREASLELSRGRICYFVYNNFSKALEHINKCLMIREKVGNKSRIAETLMWFARLHFFKGDLDECITYCEQVIANSEFPKMYKCKATGRLSHALRQKGDLELAIKIGKRWQKIAKEVNLIPCLAGSFATISNIYIMKGDLDRALDYAKHSFELSPTPGQKLAKLQILIDICLEKKNFEEANKYLNLCKEIVDQSKNENLNWYFQLSKALILKASPNFRDWVKAEMILKDCFSNKISVNIDLVPFSVHLKEWFLIHICDLLIAQLRSSNEMNLIDEINPIIKELSEDAKNQKSPWKLTKTYLLKAKLAFVQMNMGEARKFLTQAQDLADSNGLGLLARKISSEHDALLEQLSKLENVQPDLSKHNEFSSFETVIRRLLETRTADPPEIVEEDPVLLMIMAEGGVLLFSYPFTDEWKRDNQLFGSFLTAFTSFSNEFFSEGLDRVKFGSYTVLMENVDVFSIGYVYKGQTYPAKQKLKYFIEKIQNSTPIKQTLDKFYQSSQVIEPKDFPFLEAFVTDIFSGNVPRF
jgi:tetratricopeptide (TPR) repeat protein